jgi:hypothetical protein
VSAALFQPLSQAAAFWVALVLAAREPGGARLLPRVAAGLALGAALAHVGWGALHAGALRGAPAAWLDPTQGYCVLFVPLGVLCAAPRRRRARADYLAAALGALPLAFAVARLGCLAAGCCPGTASALPWSLPDGRGARAHAVAAYEALGSASLHLALRTAPRALRAGLALGGFGALRLALEPFRAQPPLGAPCLSPAWLAALWLASGLASTARSLARGRGACEPGVADGAPSPSPDRSYTRLS